MPLIKALKTTKAVMNYQEEVNVINCDLADIEGGQSSSHYVLIKDKILDVLHTISFLELGKDVLNLIIKKLDKHSIKSLRQSCMQLKNTIDKNEYLYFSRRRNYKLGFFPTLHVERVVLGSKENGVFASMHPLRNNRIVLFSKTNDSFKFFICKEKKRVSLFASLSNLCKQANQQFLFMNELNNKSISLVAAEQGSIFIYDENLKLKTKIVYDETKEWKWVSKKKELFTFKSDENMEREQVFCVDAFKSECGLTEYQLNTTLKINYMAETDNGWLILGTVDKTLYYLKFSQCFVENKSYKLEKFYESTTNVDVSFKLLPNQLFVIHAQAAEDKNHISVFELAAKVTKLASKRFDFGRLEKDSFGAPSLTSVQDKIVVCFRLGENGYNRFKILEVRRNAHLRAIASVTSKTGERIVAGSSDGCLYSCDKTTLFQNTFPFAEEKECEKSATCSIQ